ncbi:MAG: NUDIX hydrolase [Candidatus Omnitrophica bacterium]|nr:NUDIX hydrolase [Candidatus Omnitrophota bacterium]
MPHTLSSPTDLAGAADAPALLSAPLARHAVAVDVVLFTIHEGALKALLVKRQQPPFLGAWCLPGGFVRPEESVDAAALRELQEETHITRIYLEQLYTFGNLDRDPRGRVISVSYYAVVDWAQLRDAIRPPSTQDGQAAPGRWCAVTRLPELAFDHRQIVSLALERLRNKVNYTSVGFQLLPKKFTLSELQQAYEVILGTALDKRNFRKKMLQLGILRSTHEHRLEGRRRPARLYSFTQARVIKLQEKGIIVPF